MGEGGGEEEGSLRGGSGMSVKRFRALSPALGDDL